MTFQEMIWKLDNIERNIRAKVTGDVYNEYFSNDIYFLSEALEELND